MPIINKGLVLQQLLLVIISKNSTRSIDMDLKNAKKEKKICKLWRDLNQRRDVESTKSCVLVN